MSIVSMQHGYSYIVVRSAQSKQQLIILLISLCEGVCIIVTHGGYLGPCQ